MKKAMYGIAFLLVFLLNVSAHTDRVYHANNGYKAPALKVVEKGFSLSDLKGEYVLVSFWASNDVDSRISALAYDKAAEKNGGKRFRHVSVNVDASDKLFSEISRRDGMTAESLIHLDASSLPAVAQSWHLDNGLNSFLIDPAGTIIAVNPSVPALLSIMDA